MTRVLTAKRSNTDIHGIGKIKITGTGIINFGVIDFKLWISKDSRCFVQD
jgi:hypothetical protein